MQELGVIEDERGVDVRQIRTQLRMTVAERARTMVEAANVMLAIQHAAQASLQPPRRLALALQRMNAKIEMDVTVSPSGDLGGSERWDAHAIVVEISEGVSVHIAALDDIIESKRAANRLKDQRALPYLESLRDQLRS